MSGGLGPLWAKDFTNFAEKGPRRLTGGAGCDTIPASTMKS